MSVERGGLGGGVVPVEQGELALQSVHGERNRRRRGESTCIAAECGSEEWGERGVQHVSESSAV